MLNDVYSVQIYQQLLVWIEYGNEINHIVSWPQFGYVYDENI